MLKLIAADAAEDPTWTDKLEAWSTLGGAIVAALAAVATIWLLIHQILETRRARTQATQERDEATADRELARQDRELAAAERRDAEAAQARTVVLDAIKVALGDGTGGIWIGRLRTSLHNFGTLPILDVTVSLGTKMGYNPNAPVELQRTAVLGPGESLPIDTYVNQVVSIRETEAEVIEDTVATVDYTDAAGRQWRRTNDGLPEQRLD